MRVSGTRCQLRSSQDGGGKFGQEYFSFIKLFIQDIEQNKHDKWLVIRPCLESEAASIGA